MLWLTIFFVVPLGYLAYQSLQSGNFDVGYAFTWAWGNYWSAIRDYRPQFVRSIEYAGLATLIALPLTITSVPAAVMTSTWVSLPPMSISFLLCVMTRPA